MKIRTKLWFAATVSVLLIAGFVQAGNAGGKDSAIKLPRTGQTACYDSSGDEISCAKTGQDGDVQKGAAWPNPRFTANVDTAITDNLTGLVWAPNGNLMPKKDPDWQKQVLTFEGAVTWQNALDYVAKLNAENYLGHNDWRLPNAEELGSLVNKSRTDTAAWLNSQGFTNVQPGDYYWSSTSYANDTAKAWAVDMTYGNMRYLKKPNSNFVWPVRGGQ